MCLNGGTDPDPPSSGGASSSCAGGTTCTITSETVATSPADRTRTRIGVGEEVTLTVNPGPASWSITSGGGTLSPSTVSHSTVTYTAGHTGGNVTITARPAGCSCTIRFTVVEPESWTMKRKPHTNLKHKHGRPSCGFKGIVYIHPNDVNFYNIERRERDSQSTATGSYNPSHHRKWHGHYPEPERAGSWFSIVDHSETDGSKVGMVDTVYSGYPPTGATGTAPPFHVGEYYWPITHQWRVGTSAARDFPVVRQEHEIFESGRCDSRKGGHSEHTMWDDPDSDY